MKAFTFASVATFFAGLTLAHPVDLSARSGGLSEVDITILQFALTLEHLENAFYRHALTVFTLQHFLDAGFSHDFFLNLQFIATDESTHVDVLQKAISGAGVRPVAPCSYSFPVSDIASFVTISAILESVGTSAYLGAAPFVESKDILAVAGSILGVEAFHTSIQRVSIGAIGAPDPFTTPLGANAVFTLASQFITSCPADNPPLPFTAFPSLKVENAGACFRENIFAGHDISPTQGVYTVTESWTKAAESTTTTTTAAEYTTTTAAAETTTTAAAETTTTDSSSTTTTTSEAAASSTTESTTTAPVIETTTAPASETTSAEGAAETGSYKKRDLAVRQNSISCAAPSAGTHLILSADFASSKHDFRNVVQIFVTFVSGLNVISVAAQVNGAGITVIIPTGVAGQVFIFITITDISGGKIQDSDVLFGPTIFEVAPAFPTLSQ